MLPEQLHQFHGNARLVAGFLHCLCCLALMIEPKQNKKSSDQISCTKDVVACVTVCMHTSVLRVCFSVYTCNCVYNLCVWLVVREMMTGEQASVMSECVVCEKRW